MSYWSLSNTLGYSRIHWNSQENLDTPVWHLVKAYKHGLTDWTHDPQREKTPHQSYSIILVRPFPMVGAGPIFRSSRLREPPWVFTAVWTQGLTPRPGSIAAAWGGPVSRHREDQDHWQHIHGRLGTVTRETGKVSLDLATPVYVPACCPMLRTAWRTAVRKSKHGYGVTFTLGKRGLLNEVLILC